jgi:hypothetical protein
LDRGGRRAGAGRPKGSKTKKPFGNLPSAPPALPSGAPGAVIETTLEERRSWRAQNADAVHEKAERWLTELEKKARDSGDLRLEYELLRLRLAYAEGLPAAQKVDAPAATRFVIEAPRELTREEWLAQHVASRAAIAEIEGAPNAGR